MIELKDFKPNPDVPYYVPCFLPIIYEMLRHEGCHGALSLLVNLRIESLPAYSVEQNSKNAYMSSQRSSLLLEYPEFVHYFNLDCQMVGYPTFEEALAAISRQISEGQVAAVSGSSYYLPYSKDYQSLEYIQTYPNPIFGVSDHWVAVSSLSEKQVQVYDPVPDKYFGPISMKDFEGFWRGNRSIPELQAVPGIENLYIFGNMLVSAGKKLNAGEAEELSWAITKTIVFEYLRGAKIDDNDRTYYFGKQAALQLKADILKVASEDSSGAAPVAFKHCFMDQRYPRYHFLNLLQDLTSLYKLPERYFHEYAMIVKKWEVIGNRFTVDVETGKISGKKLEASLKRMDEAVSLENKFYENFSNNLESLSTAKRLPTVR